MALAIIRSIVKCLLWLRYRITIKGLAAIKARGTGGIVFLPMHPALIDPVIVVATLSKDFAPYTIADRDATDMPGIRQLASMFHVRTIPSVRKYGNEARAEMEKVLNATLQDVQQGANLLLYPAGRTMRTQREELGSNSAVASILKAAPDARIVLLRTTGLWGSSFGEAPGKSPNVGQILKRGLLQILANFIIFTPRRAVTLEFYEATDFPRTADRMGINRYLENFYNKEPLPLNTYVPYTIWEGTKPIIKPEPKERAATGKLENVPVATRDIVTRYLTELAGVATIKDDDSLVNNLGLDSLARAEMMAWLEQEFAFPATDTDSLSTVADVLLAACGESVAIGQYEMVEVPSAWFSPQDNTRCAVPAGDSINEVFLHQAEANPRRIIIADQASGAKSYHDLITGIFALLPSISALPGERIGIMLPASVPATLTYLTVLFAGKTPVLVNWTVGARNLQHSLDLAEVKQIITAQKLLTRLASQGVELGTLQERFVLLEKLAAGISKGAKLKALLNSYLGWGQLRRVTPSPTAAILFTSGSENMPKAVPLTHLNLLTNLRDTFTVIDIRTTDKLLGMLPPFHSFGLTGNMLVALCAGFQTVFHTNPTEGGMLARLIAAYQVNYVIGTPTFINGIVRSATPEQLASLHYAVTGAEECSPRVYQSLVAKCPAAKVMEGYGITECSPIVSINHQADPQPFTVGKLLPSVEFALLNVETGEPVPEGSTGMMLLRGPSIFGGYLGDAPDPFVEYDGKRWYRTGDLVQQLPDGVFKFMGRLKRFVKIGGEMISLPAIESVLLERYATPEDEGPILAVAASDDLERPELILFTVLPREREVINEQLRFSGLSPLYNIRQVIMVDAIPVLGTGKTDYRNLQNLIPH